MYTGYEMTVFGIRFTLIVGVKAGAPEWNLCCVNSKDKAIFLQDCGETSSMLYRDLKSKARIADNLKTKRNS